MMTSLKFFAFQQESYFSLKDINTIDVTSVVEKCQKNSEYVNDGCLGFSESQMSMMKEIGDVFFIKLLSYAEFVHVAIF